MPTFPGEVAAEDAVGVFRRILNRLPITVPYYQSSPNTNSHAGRSLLRQYAFDRLAIYFSWL